MHNFKSVARLKNGLLMQGFGDDFAIPFDGHAPWVISQFRDEVRKAGAIFNLEFITVHEHFHLAFSYQDQWLAMHAKRAQTGAMTKTIYVLNGPNLNLLGTREPEIYGYDTLADIESRLRQKAGDQALEFRQTNSEGQLVDWVQEASREASCLILNAGAYTHTSVALHDALRACTAPLIEVHLSNPAAREAFRQTNYVAPAAVASIAGLGPHGYEVALEAAIRMKA